MKAGRNRPTERVTAMLEVLSRLNTDEGRDPHRIDDDLSCPFIMDLLKLSEHQLNDSVFELETRELLISTESGGLRLTHEFTKRAEAR
ncbi:hypothetical protein [Hyphomicrobium facile]|uniref:hypothetical protein n=1 Tax=Hyphomicrobium facile TaxID=51670 RepID=UPI0011609DD9|nr:hypothetical protein [Hyphomicrobium facile]